MMPLDWLARDWHRIMFVSRCALDRTKSRCSTSPVQHTAHLQTPHNPVRAFHVDVRRPSRIERVGCGRVRRDLQSLATVCQPQRVNGWCSRRSGCLGQPRNTPAWQVVVLGEPIPAACGRAWQQPYRPRGRRRRHAQSAGRYCHAARRDAARVPSCEQ